MSQDVPREEPPARPEVAPPTRERLHFAQFDGLRGYGVFCVLIAHYADALTLFSSWLGPLFLRLFFVQSGFLITGILLRGRAAVLAGRAGAASVFGAFYARRSLRIFPIYYATLAVYWIIDTRGSRANLPWHASYLTNLRIVQEGDWLLPFSHFWSLAVEEQFYLVWPLVIIGLPTRALVAAVLSTLAAGPAFRAWCHATNADIFVQSVHPLAQVDFLGVGALLALFSAGYLKGHQTFVRFGEWVGRGLLATMVTLPFWPWIGLSLTSPLWWIGATSACVIWFGAIASRAAAGYRNWIGRVLEWRPAVALGRISYGVYVVHALPVIVFWDILPSGETVQDVAFNLSARLVMLLVPAIALGALSWRFLEGPANRLKRYFPEPR